ncbi:lipase 3-like [Choristoneura fumiferana]|uniref:lipase 3-like n=1 Tax=Choristoneura fumiferana TaxID=7141 RepID=UPI003D15BFE3
MHRIRCGRDRNSNPNVNRPVVFLMHGLQSSSADWVVMGPGKGLAYILAEEGFDVWLGNSRGNVYSRRHLWLDPDSDVDFWKFTWDEIGRLDVPAMIDYALEKTGKKQLHYIGFSQGTTVFFVMCSMLPKYNEKIISMNALAPVTYLTNTGNPVDKALTYFSNEITKTAEFFGVGELPPFPRWFKKAGEMTCRDDAIVVKEVCYNIVFLFGGWNPDQSNKTMIPVQLGHVPAGASFRQFTHFAQNMRSKKFRRYDHGHVGNIKTYGTWSPPQYDLQEVRAPIHLYYSLSDIRATVNDIRRLRYELPNVKEVIQIPLYSFNHLDFMWAIDAKTLVYDHVIKTMNSYHI